MFFLAYTKEKAYKYSNRIIEPLPWSRSPVLQARRLLSLDLHRATAVCWVLLGDQGTCGEHDGRELQLCSLQ